MKLHKLEFSSADPPVLQAGDPEAVVWSDEANRPVVIAKLMGDGCWFKVEGVGSFRCAPNSTDLAVRCVAHRQPGAEQRHLYDAYYRSVVPLALQVYGLETMHGAAVETAGGAVVLGGRSHAGKSTLAHVLAARGNRVVADDGVVLEIPAVAGADVQALLHPIPFSLMLRDAAVEHFGSPELSSVVDHCEPVAASVGLPIVAVVLLDRDSEAAVTTAGATRLTLQEAFTELLKSSYAFSFDKKERTAAMLRAYASFARAVPVYRLSFPSGFEHLDVAAVAVERLAADGFGEGRVKAQRSAATVRGATS